jgi:hypothetical protein
LCHIERDQVDQRRAGHQRDRRQKSGQNEPARGALRPWARQCQGGAAGTETEHGDADRHIGEVMELLYGEDPDEENLEGERAGR